MASPGSEETLYRVVTNDAGQHLVLPAVDVTPPGWHDAGHTGTHDTCLQFLRAAQRTDGPA